MAIDRKTALERLQSQVKSGRPIIGAGAGTGISAKFTLAGGVDLIIIYNSGRYRMAGRGSLAGLLAYGDANQIVLEMANEVLPIAENSAVLAGVNGTDPFKIMKNFLKQIKDIGFTGVQNFPTVGLIDGQFRQNLEETDMGYYKEVEMIAMAHDMDLLTCPYVFNENDAIEMTKAGADVIVAHMGLTTKGAIGARTALTLDDCAERIQAIHDAAKSVNPNVMVICHGGPIAEPEDAQYIFDHTKGIVGFFGASSMERIPVEVAIKANAERFKSLKMH
ncbi:MAG TPA: phosphoenolpyruvate hydrolase family protein [Coprothermobacter proteolyticus]|uniref:phosphoenolpyruvate hydrolase family protein n=1 Tax=Coprothermobacter proteolyticus TaxID=35786 RepID=UPI000D316B41|nr:phosphoenolpyruvate hydrolase family protein [Coprothermobacter proteolyticus]HOA64922.1 phosphoenolpyruvate hydrolase family protein [Coprothermobacter proteolyticus]HOK24766.1 phosphoenolpyruvate hydrolase family protein [Coprothermobacter proteolyticus]HOL53633.1 phosphoenolpyruvate hydrolase family protein [Coprothermobacter proteolyticus]HPO83977.1 phosphoenolpyruvate hydrolase family protein [Coprothermobacter proteolyticus]HPU70143.1 phosphoenolpyruvate hydrolase family protein [Copr